MSTAGPFGGPIFFELQPHCRGFWMGRWVPTPWQRQRCHFRRAGGWSGDLLRWFPGMVHETSWDPIIDQTCQCAAPTIIYFNPCQPPQKESHNLLWWFGTRRSSNDPVHVKADDSLRIMLVNLSSPGDFAEVILSWIPHPDEAAAPAAPAAPVAPAADGGAGGNSPRGTRPGYKQQPDPWPFMS